MGRVDSIIREQRMQEAWKDAVLNGAPKCKQHGRFMVPKVTSTGEPRPFWGCPRYPDCTNTQSVWTEGYRQIKSSGGRRVAFRTGKQPKA